ncbi:MAG: HD domain-containing protein [Bacillota bacterium]|nr:HD domain-containing protein [Bacillota bacterium]
MKNHFLDKNEKINEKISAFRAEPTVETYGAILEQIRERMQEDGHFLIPVWTPEEEKDSEMPSMNLHQLHTEDGGIYLVAFTDEEEVHKGQKTAIVSHFIDQFFDFVFISAPVDGFILNPWSENNFTFSKGLMQTIVTGMEEETDVVKSNELLHKAIHFAADRHLGGVRKGTSRPYIGHPLEVMNILNRMEADNNLMMAGLLHDTVEDTETTYAEIKEAFGFDVAALVAVHTKNPDATWEEVRKHKIAAMDDTSFRGKMLIMADMVANLRSMWGDYRHIGEELWKRFNAPKEKQAWYYGTMQDKLDMMQNYMETSEIYWEMVGLYKDLFVEYYLDEERDIIYQCCADGTCFALQRKDPVWQEAAHPKHLPLIVRRDAERLEDNWRDVFMSQQTVQ